MAEDVCGDLGQPVTQDCARKVPTVAASLLAMGLPLLFAIVGGLCGYWSTEPLYVGTGMIHVKPYIRTLPPYDLSEPRRYESFRRAQVAKLQEPHLVELAMASPKWRSLNRSAGPEAVQRFLSQLQVHSTGGEFVIVEFADSDPNVCRVAVEALLRAYRAHCLDTNPGPAAKVARIELIDGKDADVRAEPRQQREALLSAAVGLAIGAPIGITLLERRRRR